MYLKVIESIPTPDKVSSEQDHLPKRVVVLQLKGSETHSLLGEDFLQRVVAIWAGVLG